MAEIKKDAAYYAEDKRRQEAVDKRGYYTEDDRKYVMRTGNEKDRRRMKSMSKKRSSKR